MSTPTGSITPQPSQATGAFDIVAAYQRLLASDADLTMPVAAIEALVEALTATNIKTMAETLDLVEEYTAALKGSVANPISLSAGTDLFRRYIITSFNRPGAAGDWSAIRHHLISNGRRFVENAKASRDQIASRGSLFVRDNTTILTNGGSRVVSALLKSAAGVRKNKSNATRTKNIRFRVIYVLSNTSDEPTTAKDEAVGKGSAGEGVQIVAELRDAGIPVATIPESAVAYSMPQVSMVIVGAEGVVESGGIISRMGTYQIGILAKAAGKPLYVVSESHKFVRLYPLSQYDLPIEQNVVQFIAGKPGSEELLETERGPTHQAQDNVDEGIDLGPEKRGPSQVKPVVDAVDFTPPDFISGIITESGVLTPSAVSEELIKIWF